MIALASLPESRMLRQKPLCESGAEVRNIAAGNRRQSVRAWLIARSSHNALSAPWIDPKINKRRALEQ